MWYTGVYRLFSRWEERKMTALELKMIAWIMMTAGYLGEIFFPGSFPLAAAGTVALPLFAYLTAESCRYTHRWPGYMKRLLLLAVVCEIPFDLATSGLLFWPLRQSPVVSQLLAVAGIAFFDRYSDREWRFLPLVGACILSAFLMGDYGFYGVILVVAFYLYGPDPSRCSSFLGVITLLFGASSLMSGVLDAQSLLPLFALAACPLFFFYNGLPGDRIKKPFYLGYPLLLLVLWAMTFWMPTA